MILKLILIHSNPVVFNIEYFALLIRNEDRHMRCTRIPCISNQFCQSHIWLGNNGSKRTSYEIILEQRWE